MVAPLVGVLDLQGDVREHVAALAEVGCGTRLVKRLDDLDGLDGWTAAAWRDALDGYFDLYDELGTGPDARGPSRLLIEEGKTAWTVRQIFDDPAGDHDWGISATVDLAASDEEGAAVIHVTDVGQL